MSAISNEMIVVFALAAGTLFLAFFAVPLINNGRLEKTSKLLSVLMLLLTIGVAVVKIVVVDEKPSIEDTHKERIPDGFFEQKSNNSPSKGFGFSE